MISVTVQLFAPMEKTRTHKNIHLLKQLGMAWATCGDLGNCVGCSCEELNSSYDLVGVARAWPCADAAEDRTPKPFCWQAFETDETGMKPL
jgi:hypothetical protein